MNILKCTVSWLLFCLIPLIGMAQQSTSYFLHTISKGQSLYSIAAMYSVSTEDIIRLNPGCDKIIKAGETLKIPQTQASSRQKFHTIQPGETLYRLTQQYQVSAQKICNANPGLSAQNFKAGQVIVIPERDESVVASPVVQATPSQPVQTTTVTPKTSQNSYQDIHKVKRRETIYSICKDYGITRQELIDANPELKTESLKKGKYLRIPYPKQTGKRTYTSIPQATNDRPLAQSSSQLTDREIFDKVSTPKQQLGTVKVAVLLPFLLGSEKSGEQMRMVEYYEGFLMAVDSLQRQGYSYDIYTYDTRGENASIRQLLAKPELKEMNLIIGPVHSNHIKEVAKFAKENHIRMIIPFSSKDNEVFNNPYVYQINTPQSYLYSEVYDHFVRTFRHGYHIVFVDTQDGNTQKVDFVKGLKNEMNAQQIPYKELVLQNKNDEFNLATVADSTKANLFIPTSGSNIALIKFMPHLKQLALEHPNTEMHLFGYPEWQTYTNDYISEFYAFDTYFYGSFYANNLSVSVANFQHKYRKWYGKTVLNTYPKYALLGFDTGYYFLKGLSVYGNDLENNLQKVNFAPIQTGFKFERVNNWGGFINKKVFFVHFTKNHELIKMDFDR